MFDWFSEAFAPEPPPPPPEPAFTDVLADWWNSIPDGTLPAIAAEIVPAAVDYFLSPSEPVTDTFLVEFTRLGSGAAPEPDAMMADAAPFAQADFSGGDALLPPWAEMPAEVTADPLPAFEAGQEPFDGASFSSMPETFAAASGDAFQGGFVDDAFAIIQDWVDVFSDMFAPQAAAEGCLTADAFQDGGRFDPVNECVVSGRVDQDIQYIQEQFGETCSLMAQEQFIYRYTGERYSEAELSALASEMGVFTPEGGTNFIGWDALLKATGVPTVSQYFTAGPDQLHDIITSGHDALVGVDARTFYDDPNIPPGSGHAVSIVGYGNDPDSGAFKGYYFTDSNYPGQARFVEADAFHATWNNSFIAIPESVLA